MNTKKNYEMPVVEQWRFLQPNNLLAKLSIRFDYEDPEEIFEELEDLGEL